MTETTTRPRHSDTAATSQRQRSLRLERVYTRRACTPTTR